MKLFSVTNPPTKRKMLYAAVDKQQAYEVATAVLTELWITSKGICEKKIPFEKAQEYIEEIPDYSIEGNPGLVFTEFQPYKVGE